MASNTMCQYHSAQAQQPVRHWQCHKAADDAKCSLFLCLMIAHGMARMHATAYLYVLDLGLFLMLLLKVLVYGGQLLYILQQQQ